MKILTEITHPKDAVTKEYVDAHVSDPIYYGDTEPSGYSLWWKILLPIPEADTLDGCSWANIREISDAGVATNYWNIGDCKEITINGQLSKGLTLNNAQLWVFIIGFDHDISIELNGGHTITFNGFKTSINDSDTYALCDSGYINEKTSGTWFNMNNSNTNTGSWNSSGMRSTVIPQIISCLPLDLQSVLKTVKKKSIETYDQTTLEETSDKLFLLAESEIFGGTVQAKTSEGTQYPWFTSKGITTSSYANNVRKKYTTSAQTAACFWWERSPYSKYSNLFCNVNTNGAAGGSDPSFSYGVSPAFCV